MGASALSAHWAHGQPMLVPPLFQAQTGAQAITAVTTTTAAAMPSPATHHQAGPAGNLLAANNTNTNNAFAPFAMCALPPAVQTMPMLGGGAFHAAVHAAATVTTAFPPSTAPAAVTNPAESAAPKQVVAVSMRGASPGHPSPLPSHCGSQHHAAHGASAAVAGESPTNAESLNGSDSDFVWVGQRAVSPTNQPTMPSELSQQQYAANQQASAEAAAAAAAEAEEAAYLRGLLDLANLLARGGAIADLAALSADGMAHGESLSPVEALALHVKALDLMSNGIKLAEQVAAAASLTPPRLQPAAAEAIAQAEALRARGSGLLRSAEGVRQQIAASSGSVSATSRRASIVGGPNSGAIVGGGGGGDAGGAFLPEEGASVGGASPSASASGGAAAGGGEAAARCGGGSAHMSVCVEEVLYRQALCMGREAAVDELLGHYESSAALYVRAKLTLEQLEHEPMVGEADRAVLSKYGAGFAWRLSSLRSKASMGSLAASPSASAGGGMPATHHPALSEGGQLGLASPDRSLSATAPPS